MRRFPPPLPDHRCCRRHYRHYQSHHRYHFYRRYHQHRHYHRPRHRLSRSSCARTRHQGRRSFFASTIRMTSTVPVGLLRGCHYQYDCE